MHAALLVAPLPRLSFSATLAKTMAPSAGVVTSDLVVPSFSGATGFDVAVVYTTVGTITDFQYELNNSGVWTSIGASGSSVSLPNTTTGVRIRGTGMSAGEQIDFTMAYVPKTGHAARTVDGGSLIGI